MAANPSLPNMTTPRKWGSLNETNYNFETTIEVSQILVTSAQLLALNTTPINIVPAGLQLGEVILVDYVTVRLAYNSVAYTLNGGNLKVFYGPVANAIPVTADLSGILTQTNNAISIVPVTQAILAATTANATQQGLYLGNAVANYTLGNSPITVTVFYSKTTP